MRYVYMVFALVVGMLTWGLAGLNLLVGAFPGWRLMAFLAPLLGGMLPLFVACSRAKAHWVAAWVAALAPLVGIANIILVWFIATSFATPVSTDSAQSPKQLQRAERREVRLALRTMLPPVVGWSSLVWSAPLIGMVFVATRRRMRKAIGERQL